MIHDEKWRIQGRTRGFSLIELLTVIAIVSLLTLVAIGSYANFRKSRRTVDAAQSVQSAMVAARSYAITSGSWYTLVFQFVNPMTNEPEVSYWIDEVVPKSTKSAATASAPFPPSFLDRKRMRVTTPELVPPGLKVTLDINTTGTVSYPSSGVNYAAILFREDGTSDQASVQMVDDNADASQASNYTTVKLYGPTAKPRVIAHDKK